jgi:hypothetical protein
MTDKASAKSKRAVREWFAKEGMKVESITNARAEYLFKVKFMRYFFTAVRPNDQNYIQLETQVMISPQHLQLLTAEKMQKFQMEAMRFAFQSGVNMGFVQPRPGQQGPKPPGPGFVVSDRIYDDAYSDDRMWHSLRRLHSSVDMVIAILNDVTGAKPGKPPATDEAPPSYYT